MYRIVKGVKRWVYLTNRNLNHLRQIPLDPRILIKVPNALEIVKEPLSFNRKDLGISDSATVFAVISRAIPEKGWKQAALAFRLASANQKLDIHLLFCGTGPEQNHLEDEFASPHIHFLGFQSNPHGIYSLCDCALLPSRFGGESYPLTLIEALQVGKPAVCTNIGECQSMITSPNGMAGIIINPATDENEFVNALSEAIVRMCDRETYAELKRFAVEVADKFSSETMIKAYTDIYSDVLREHSGKSTSVNNPFN
jgi:glycosyltransferase involved in cell wall biosynthesis